MLRLVPPKPSEVPCPSVSQASCNRSSTLFVLASNKCHERTGPGETWHNSAGRKSGVRKNFGKRPAWCPGQGHSRFHAVPAKLHREYIFRSPCRPSKQPQGYLHNLEQTGLCYALFSSSWLTLLTLDLMTMTYAPSPPSVLKAYI